MLSKVPIENKQWHKYEIFYTARGGEFFFTIGLFENYPNLYTNVLGGELNKAFYLVDKIVLEEEEISNENY
jgi:hypothetical protein